MAWGCMVLNVAEWYKMVLDGICGIMLCGIRHE